MLKKLVKRFVSSILIGSLSISIISGCGNQGPFTSLSINSQDKNIIYQSKSTDKVKPYTLLSFQSLDSDLGDIYDQTPIGENGEYTHGQITQYSIMSDVNAMEQVGSSPNLNIYSWLDFFGPKDTFNAYIVQDNNPDKITSELKPLRERNMGYYKNLEKFVSEGLQKYPGNKVILDISSHGGGYWGISPDYTSKNKRISLLGLELALHNAIKGTRKLDLISFYACLMSGVEVAYQLKDDVKVMVGSGDVMTSNMGGSNTSYYKNFDIINKQPTIDEQNLAKHIVNNTLKNYASTYTAVQTTRTLEVRRAIDQMARVLIKYLPTRKKDIFNACLLAKKYPNLFESNINSAIAYLKKNKPNYTQEDVIFYANLMTDIVDIKALTEQLREQLKDIEEVIQTTQIVDQTIDHAVIAVKTLTNNKWGGLSIYLPFGLKKVDPVYFKTKFAADTQWDTFLNQLTK